jgi:acyl-CoA synthetase (NDP forming)
MHLEAAGQIARDASKAVIEAGDRLTPLSEKTIKKRREMKPPILAISRCVPADSFSERFSMS